MTVKIDIEAIDRASSVINNILQKAGLLGSTFQAIAGKISGVVASGRALQEIVIFMQEAITAAAGAETEVARLDAALKSMGRTATAEGLGKIASGLQSISAFDDDDLIRGFASLSKFEAIDTSKFEDIAKAAMDISAATGGDVASNMESIGRILETGVIPKSWAFSAALKEQIKSQIEAGNTANALTLILEELNKRYGGQAAAQMNTYAGSVANLKNQWSGLKELIGGRWLGMGTGGTTLLSSAVEQATNILGDFFNWFDARTSGETGKSFVDWQYQQMNFSKSISDFAFSEQDMFRISEDGYYSIVQGAVSANLSVEELTASTESLRQSIIDRTTWEVAYTGAKDAADQAQQSMKLLGGMMQGLGAEGSVVWEGFLSATGQISEEAATQFAKIYSIVDEAKRMLSSGVPIPVVVQFMVSSTAGGTFAAPSKAGTGNWVRAGPGWITNTVTGEYEEDPSQQAGGGAFSGWAMVGDAPGGGVTPYTEFVYAPHGAVVYNQAQMSGKAPAPSAAIGGFIPPAVSGAASNDMSMEMREFARYIVDELRRTTG